jgi:3D (Asp-Asp-Asp) domain-containing protein
LVVAFMSIITICFLGFVAAPKNIVVVADGVTTKIEVRALTVKGALADAGVVLSDADGYVITNADEFKDGATVEVIRAMPIKVWKAGKTTEYSIGRGTVKEALDAVGVEYGNCKVYPALSEKPTAGMTINVITNRAKMTTELRDLPYEVKLQNSDNLPRGRREVITPGTNGETKVTISVETVGNRQFNREVCEEVVTPAQPEVVAVGTGANMLETARGYVRYRQVKEVEATAYTLAEGSGAGVTSTGIVPYKGIIAVDPSEIPYGTRVYIPGYGFAMAGDTGGAIQGNRIDLYMDRYPDAVNWGRRTVNMYILE